MIVVDAGAVVDRLTGRPANDALVARFEQVGLHAPHLIDVEFLSALRGLALGRKIARPDATAARQDFGDLPIHRYPHVLLAERIWGLRHNLSAYDAAYVALSEALRMPLVTTDARLERASGHHAQVEVFTRQ